MFDRALLYDHLMPDQRETEPRVLPQPKQLAQTVKLSTVLIVDDYNINRLLVIDILQNQVEHFLEAGNGREAIEILQKERVDLVRSISPASHGSMSGRVPCTATTPASSRN